MKRNVFSPLGYFVFLIVLSTVFEQSMALKTQMFSRNLAIFIFLFVNQLYMYAQKLLVFYRSTL